MGAQESVLSQYNEEQLHELLLKSADEGDLDTLTALINFSNGNTSVNINHKGDSVRVSMQHSHYNFMLTFLCILYYRAPPLCTRPALKTAWK